MVVVVASRRAPSRRAPNKKASKAAKLRLVAVKGPLIVGIPERMQGFQRLVQKQEGLREALLFFVAETWFTSARSEAVA
jgi:hypothetical protein